MNYYSKEIKIIKKWCWLDTEDTNFYYKLSPINEDHLAHIISTITGKDHNKIFSFFSELENNIELKNHISAGIYSAKYGRDIRVDFGRRMGWYAMARAIKPKIIIETGVEHGVGSCVLTCALMKNAEEGNPGYYYGTDINLKAGQLLSGIYAKFGEIIYGDSITSLNKFEGTVDLFINDSGHSSKYEYDEYQTIYNKLSDNAIILGDNSHVTQSLSIFSLEHARNFLFFSEKPLNHWYPGAGIGFSYKK